MKTIYEITADLLKTGNKKQIFDLLYLIPENEIAEMIADFLKDCSTTFVSDIAGKYTTINISEKQAWCMTFESIKIAHMFEAWMEKNSITLTKEELEELLNS